MMNKIVEALREARRWIGDGDLSDGMHSDIWTPRYAAAIAMIDAALAEPAQQEPVKGKRYEAGDWSMRNYEAWTEDQGAQPAAQPLSVTDEMLMRFLGWPLPKDFAPDCGISFDGRKDDQWNKNKTWPIGTNLLTADQARAMFAHVLGIGKDAP